MGTGGNIHFGVLGEEARVTAMARHKKSRASALAMRAGVAGGVVSTLAVAGASGAASSKEGEQGADSSDLLMLALIFGVAMAFVVGFAIPWFVTRQTYMKHQNEHFTERIKAERERHQQAMEQLRKTTQLVTLMELNQDQIKTYHDIVTEQAEKSFKSARNAMTAGLLLLVAAAAGGVKVPVEEIRWFIGALAMFSTMFSAYLSRTYLMLYRESISQLNRYFDQPVQNSYYLTAERLAAGLEGESAQSVRKQIMDQVLETSTRIGGRPVTQQEPVEMKPKAARPKPKKRKKRAAAVNGTPHP
ncbi:hypothetical protein [Streptomyces olivaceus]|uniref:hypothetical protein n=1 Tax=Streptomyces olivaceus TaxID=47716 RepID=UPI0021E15664|nr:hypothetical protein [Streptomyces olivaceus]